MLPTGGGPNGKTGPRQVVQIGRNEPCPCGSGKKYKQCHMKDGQAFFERMAREEHKKQLKAQGVPWYKRMLA